MLELGDHFPVPPSQMLSECTTRQGDPATERSAPFPCLACRSASSAAFSSSRKDSISLRYLFRVSSLLAFSAILAFSKTSTGPHLDPSALRTSRQCPGRSDTPAPRQEVEDLPSPLFGSEVLPSILTDDTNLSNSNPIPLGIHKGKIGLRVRIVYTDPEPVSAAGNKGVDE